MPTPGEILKQYWGYDSFRPLQEDIIHSVLEGKDTLALLPTGGGKSICFQVPALCLEGLTLVITPLVALMIDQVENLKKRSVPAIEIHSGMHPREIQLAYQKCAEGSMKFLYLSPERLDSDSFREMASFLKVSLIAVDEAHCISQWGYDFRPPYLKIAEIRPLFGDIPVIALTATAVSKVIDDIQSKLLFKKYNVFRKSFYRSNLSYVVYKEEDKLKKLLRVCNGVKGTGIVYVRNRKLTRETAEYLNRNGIKAGYYHAGLDPAVRSGRQKEWMDEKIRVMVSTNAFGMGIDKPNVRFVVHLDLPENLEAYFQEAGRAGRDEKKAYAVILYNESDVIDTRHYLEIAWPSPELIKQVYLALGNYLQLAVGSGKDHSFDFELESFAANYNMKPVTVFNVLRILERDGYLSFSNSSNETSRAFFLVGREELYKFQVEHREADRLIKVLLRSYAGLFTDFTSINEYELARRMGADRETVIEQLDYLRKSGILEYIPLKGKPQLVFTTERIPPEDIGLSKTYYFDRKKEAKVKLEQMLKYTMQNEKCRSLFLLEYFGDLSGIPCGVCDICLKNKKTGISDEEVRHIADSILEIVKRAPVTLTELILHIPSVSEKKVLEVVQWLVDEEQVFKEDDKLEIRL